MIRIAWVVMGLLLMPTLQASSLEYLLDCRSVGSDIKRLECFDTTTAEFCATNSCEAGAKSDESGIQATPTAAEGATFGLSEKLTKNEPGQIESNIRSIRLAAYGKHVFTLENDQVWMENEPGRKKVKNHNQKVIIKKKSLRYLISFESGVALAVHRIE